MEVALPKKANKLVLVVTDGGDGNNYDHADWINPTIELKNGEKVDLTECQYTKSATGWGKIAVNRNIDGAPLHVAGTKYDKGIACHSNSVLVYDLPAGAVRFTALAGIDDSGIRGGAKSSMEFLVFDYDATDDAQDITPATITLDFTKLGIPADKKCKITEMWSGKVLGTFKSGKFKKEILPHASELYKLTPVD